MVERSARTDVDESAPSDRMSDAARWHGGWTAAVLIALVGVTAGAGRLDGAASLALVLGALPGAIALLLRRKDGLRRVRGLLLAVWGGCAAAAAFMVGGLDGPLAVWCFAPLAAAAAFGSAGLLAEAVAISVAVAGALALAGLAGLTPARPPQPLDFWLAFVGLMTTAPGLGAGLLLWRRHDVQARGELKASESGLERLLAEQPHLILSLDAAGRVIAAFGTSPEGVPDQGLEDRPFIEIVDEADRKRLGELLIKAMLEGEAEADFRPAQAADRCCVVTVRRSDDGRMAAVVRDATGQASREAELEAAREAAESLNAGKSRFLANMSHELRTPLNAIIGFSDVMRSKLFGDLPPRYAEYAEMIHDAGGHLLDLINDVLDISKIEAERYELRREVFDGRDAVSSALRLTRLQADAAGIQLRGLLPQAPLEVEADPRAIKQIVLNLVSNALKFTPSGGSVTVALSGVGEDLEIVVSDTGVGIAEADLKRLGRPYEQAGDADQKLRGTGLGLSLVRAFAELHGGGMSIESRLGEGTAVTVRMPVRREAPPAGGPQEGDALPGGAQIIAFNPNAGR